jgi:hypothetical protein
MESRLIRWILSERENDAGLDGDGGKMRRRTNSTKVENGSVTARE